MFDLEAKIREWRQQMLAAGVKTPVPLEELESHLRAEIERQIQAGMDGQSAFEISVAQLGRPEMLGREFQKNEGRWLKVTGIGIAVAGTAIISRILTEHPDAEHLRPHEQIVWLVAGSALALGGIGLALLRAGSDRGMVRWWKLIGVGYSIVASAFAIYLTTRCLAAPQIRQAFTLADWLAMVGASAVCIFSIVALRLGHGLLPVVPNWRVRLAVGIGGPLLGALGMLAYVIYVIPQQVLTAANHSAALFLIALAGMALLGGAGCGLEKAAHKSIAN